MYDWSCDADEYREVLSRIFKKVKAPWENPGVPFLIPFLLV